MHTLDTCFGGHKCVYIYEQTRKLIASNNVYNQLQSYNSLPCMQSMY